MPWTGLASSTMPTPMARTAENRDHQKPGIFRAQNVSGMPPLGR